MTISYKESGTANKGKAWQVPVNSGDSGKPAQLAVFPIFTLSLHYPLPRVWVKADLCTSVMLTSHEACFLESCRLNRSHFKISGVETCLGSAS